MYAAFPDPDCYAGSDVLRNRLDIRDAARLDAFEEEMTRERWAEPLPAGRLSVTHLRAIHRHLFQDVYPWAGKFRRVRMEKGESRFCEPEYIAGQLRSLFDRLRERRYLRGLDADAFAFEAAHFLSELNVIHPFREGNGRTQMTFMILLAERAGHPLDIDPLDRGTLLSAMIASFKGDERPLAVQIRRLLE